MKKLSLLVALALVISVGGVYATWFYAETTMKTSEHEFKNLGITDVNTLAQTGTITVTDTLILKIDDNAGNHTPGWDADVNAGNAGKISIVFTPNSGANDTTLKYTVTIANNTYTPEGGSAQPIFTTDTIDAAHTEAKVVLQGTFDYISPNASVTKEILLADITSELSVNNAFTLPTIDDYNAYSTALDNVVLKLTIEEVTTP